MTSQIDVEHWRLLLALRREREIIQRWLSYSNLTDDMRLNIQAMLRDVEEQLQTLTNNSSQ